MRKSFRERSPWVVGTASILLISVAVGFAFSINRFSFIKGVYPIYAELEDAAGLIPGNEVRIAGVKIGTVTEISLNDDAAIVKMEVQRDIEIPEDTRLEVKLKTLLGQKFIDLQVPRSFLASASGGREVAVAGGFLEAGDVIPLDHTRVPFEIYQASTEGTAKLAEIDKKALRKMLVTLADTLGASKGELRRLIVSLESASVVLDERNPDISGLLRNLRKVSGTLAASDQDLDGILLRSSEVFTTLAEERATTSSLLAATSDLTENLGLLIQVAKGSIEAGTTDLNSVLLTVERDFKSISTALAELAITQELFARPLTFGRFVEGHACAITTEDVCVPFGTPEDPKVPVKGTQPPPAPPGVIK